MQERAADFDAANFNAQMGDWFELAGDAAGATEKIEYAGYYHPRLVKGEMTNRRRTAGLALLLALAVPAAAQEAGPTEAEAAALLKGDWRERIEGLEVALNLGRNASPELRLAVIDAARAEFRGETSSPPESEAILGYLHAVQGLQDPRAIPFLVEASGTVDGSGIPNHLADFGAALAFPPVLAAVSDRDEHPRRVSNGLTALRFLLTDGALTAEQTERTRAVVQERLSGSQHSFVVHAAIRLALLLGDPGLRAIVERVADDRATAEALVSPYLSSGELTDAESHALTVNAVQNYARTFLDGGGGDIGPFRRRGGGLQGGTRSR